MKNKIFTILFGISVFFFIISFSIGLPIYCRFFYYLHINGLSLPEKTGYSYSQIKFAFDEVMNYLTLPNRTFNTGVFRYTQSGADHFADCKKLFNLNLIVLLSSSAIMLATFILKKTKKIELFRPFNFGITFFSSISIFIISFILVCVVAIDFDSAFIVFHHIFFPGKDNWQFNPNEMEIINVLPQQFFMNCAILIVVSIVLICSFIIIYQIIKRRKLQSK